MRRRRKPRRASRQATAGQGAIAIETMDSPHHLFTKTHEGCLNMLREWRNTVSNSRAWPRRPSPVETLQSKSTPPSQTKTCSPQFSPHLAPKKSFCRMMRRPAMQHPANPRSIAPSEPARRSSSPSAQWVSSSVWGVSESPALTIAAALLVARSYALGGGHRMPSIGGHRYGRNKKLRSYTGGSCMFMFEGLK